MSPRLLVIDDDAALNLALCAHFEDRGWRATGVYDCAAARAQTTGAGSAGGGASRSERGGPRRRRKTY